MDYVVKSHAFEGPLDLLLELVSSRKLFVNDISLAQVTDDFIKYLEEREEVPLSESAEFILIASTLMLIKSRSLLPELALTEEEEENIHDLKNRLEAYAKVKELAALLKDIFGAKIIFEKEPRKNETVIFAPDRKTDLPNLSQALEQLIITLPKKEVLPTVTVKKVISLEEMITRLSERISKASRMSFKDLAGHGGGELTHEKKVSVIVGFLAMLELVKRGVIRASQESEHEIEIESESLSTPTYV